MIETALKKERERWENQLSQGKTNLATNAPKAQQSITPPTQLVQNASSVPTQQFQNSS